MLQYIVSSMLRVCITTPKSKETTKQQKKETYNKQEKRDSKKLFQYSPAPNDCSFMDHDHEKQK